MSKNRKAKVTCILISILMCLAAYTYISENTMTDSQISTLIFYFFVGGVAYFFSNLLKLSTRQQKIDSIVLNKRCRSIGSLSILLSFVLFLLQEDQILLAVSFLLFGAIVYLKSFLVKN